ncbi:unnamed protein product [Effrenium voratum]|nr:unnamed protein product [Effrenium voratum]
MLQFNSQIDDCNRLQCLQVRPTTNHNPSPTRTRHPESPRSANGLDPRCSRRPGASTHLGRRVFGPGAPGTCEEPAAAAARGRPERLVRGAQGAARQLEGLTTLRWDPDGLLVGLVFPATLRDLQFGDKFNQPLQVIKEPAEPEFRA